MSTELLTIIGRFEFVKNVEKRESGYAESIVSFVGFSGGVVNGHMLQMTIQQSDGETAFVQLTRDQVKEMLANLGEVFG